MEIGSPQWKNIIRQGAQTLGVDVSSETADKFSAHARELIKWNQKVNLTAITDPFEIAVKHFVDSIAAADNIPPNSSMLDIGSGGGFPGIPLKTLIPTLNVVLVDAARKKISFLKHVCRTLQLDEIDAHHIRGEDISIAPGFQETRSEFRKVPLVNTTPVTPKPFDVVISRAFTSLTDFILMALPMLADEGVIVALAGKVAYSEMESLRLRLSNDPMVSSRGGDDLSIALKAYKLPFIDAQRSLVSICKKSPPKSVDSGDSQY
jgi:16S rRNA (guanine527-N7)-methyltransferase